MNDESSTTHYWKAPKTINGTRYDFFTVTDDRAVLNDLHADHDTSFLRRDVCLRRIRGTEPVEEFCQRRRMEAHALLAEAALQHHIATVHQVNDLCSATETKEFNEQECELVDVVAPTGPSMRVWRRVRK